MTNSLQLNRRSFLTLSAGALGAPALMAQDIFPSKSIQLVVPFPAGGYADSVARILAPSLEKLLGQPVVVLNKGGAGGSIGSAFVAQARPDGHTVLLTLSSLTTLPEQAIVNSQKPSFTLSQFKPLARLTVDPMAFIVRAESPIKSLSQLMSEAQAKPSELTYGSSGNYGAVHVPMEMFLNERHIKVRHIPYPGGAPLMLALLTGEIDFTMVPRSLLSAQARAGKVRVLATLGREPWAGYDNVPTTTSLGLKFDYPYWTGVFAPSQISPAAMQVWRNALRAAVDEPEVKAGLAKMESRPTYLDAAEFAPVFEAETIQATKMIRLMGKLD